MNIVLYSTHCPKCSILEKKLQLKNIKYIEVNDIDIMNGKGILSVPVLEVDEHMMNFSEAVQWVNQQEELTDEH